MKLKTKIIVVSILIGCLILGSGILEANSEEDLTEPIVLNLNTVGGPEQAQVKGYREAKEYIYEKSEGKVVLQIFHSGLLGEAADAVMDIEQGTTDISVVSPTWMAEYYPPAGALEFPYIIESYDHLYNVLYSNLGQKLLNGFEEETNTIILDNWYFGTRQTFSTEKATTPEEFKGLVYRCPNSPVFFEAVEVLGASPTPMPIGEVYLGFQTGTVQATFFPYGDAYQKGFHEVADYVIKTGDVVYSIQPIINEKKWNSIPEKYQKIILEGFQKGKEVNNSIVLEAEEEMEEVFKDHGLEIVEPELDLFIKRAQDLWKEYEQDWGSDLVEKIKSLK